MRTPVVSSRDALSQEASVDKDSKEFFASFTDEEEATPYLTQYFIHVFVVSCHNVMA
ncbi:hypothetical protein ACJX0J_039656, partial [Zea mays]